MRKKKNCVFFLTILCCMISGWASAETDYDSLCRMHSIGNTDVIAWLEIPGTSICEPIMRHSEDDVYYATHDADGRENKAGSLYVQAKYNADDFSDPVTLIYGSSVAETAPFVNLQELYAGSFAEIRKMYVHMPQETCEYNVFAALPYSSIHILHYYDFGVERRYSSFFDSVFSTRALGMHLDEKNRPAYGEDRVVILSTGLRGASLQRYLVMARKVKNE